MVKGTVKIKLTHPDAKLPVYAKEGDAGADVFAVEKVLIPNGATRIVDLGLSIQLSPGWEMQVRSRSGNAFKGLVVANSPGTIDSGYRGPCKAILHNQSGGDWLVNVGDKVAQFVLKQSPVAEYIQVDELESSERGAGGFGSTGK
jgi:dUTP pyrophosphatase